MALITPSEAKEKIRTSPTGEEKQNQARVAGNLNGDVSLVEFFDYNCGYCRLALPTVI
jgi:protein-disulfide isomerase